MNIIDVSVNLGRWPFCRFPYDETPRLVENLRRHGVTQAWTGSLEGVFHREMGGVNARLAAECRQHDGLLVPFGSVNPKLPDWQEDLRRCAEDYRMPGIRLHPNYHGYSLTDRECAELLAAAEKRGLIVQLVMRMDDKRVHHPLFPVPEVDLKPLADVLKNVPKLRLVLLNGVDRLRLALKPLAASGRAWFDFATLDGLGGVERLLQSAPHTQVVLGSHSPLFSLESALLKLKESQLSDQQESAIRHANAQRLLPPKARG
jgi:uncharacterized protein